MKNITFQLSSVTGIALCGSLLLQPCLIFSQGKIIMNGGKMNAVNSAYVVTGDVSFSGASALTINNSTIKISGSISSSAGLFDVTNGTVEMNGTALQTIPANSFAGNKIMNLVISNDVDLAGQDSITRTLSFGNANNKTFATNGFLTLRSTAAGTARLADITNAGTNTGNTVTGAVKIERYLSAHRAWRLLTAPINASSPQTIRSAWQEGVNNTSLNYASNQDPVPRYGTHITWGNASAAGFDVGINGNAGIKSFNPLTGAWDGLTNTNITLTTDHSAYMVFVRGNRSVDLSQGVNAAPSPATLRSTGQLKTGNQSFAVAATGFTPVGNPFASPVDLYNLAKINSTNVQDNFYLWDPKITGSAGVGGFVNVSWDAANSVYDITPFTGDGISQYISSGFGFFVKSADNATPGTLVIKETDKTALNSDDVNRPLNSAGAGKLITNLYSIDSDGTTAIVDGLLNSFGNGYADAVNNDDAVKLDNFAENVSSIRDGKALTVERRQPVTVADTIFLNMLNMKVKPYRFEFTANLPAAYGLTGFLEDSYLHTSTPVSLNGTTSSDFNIKNIPGSWNPGRFRIVFRQSEVLPVTFNSIRAFKKEEDIEVQWQVENEAIIKHYEVERSANGRNFTRTAIVPQSNDHAYHWLDENPVKENNYYRIKSVGINDDIYYSSIVKVYLENDRHEILVPDHQLANGAINFSFVNMPAGNYRVSVFNTLAQMIATRQIKHAQGSASQSIQLNRISAKGEYILEIIRPDDKKLSYKIFLY